MTVEQGTLDAESGDSVILTMWDHGGEPPTISISVVDVDGTDPPTAELTMAEADRLREMVRQMQVEAARHQMERMAR